MGLFIFFGTNLIHVFANPILTRLFKGTPIRF